MLLLVALVSFGYLSMPRRERAHPVLRGAVLLQEGIRAQAIARPILRRGPPRVAGECEREAASQETFRQDSIAVLDGSPGKVKELLALDRHRAQRGRGGAAVQGAASIRLRDERSAARRGSSSHR